jgi:hypothetical protein
VPSSANRASAVPHRHDRHVPQLLPARHKVRERQVQTPGRRHGYAAAASVRENVSRWHESVRQVYAVPERQAATAAETAELSAQPAERHIPELLSATDGIQKRTVRSRQVPAGHGWHATELRLSAGHQVPERLLPGACGSDPEAHNAASAAELRQGQGAQQRSNKVRVPVGHEGVEDWRVRTQSKLTRTSSPYDGGGHPPPSKGTSRQCSAPPAARRGPHQHRSDSQ